jgi:CRISPR/Cas system-associated exonuclease Cas4 (RecB family)
MVITTTANVRLKKDDIIEAIDLLNEKKGIERRGAVEFSVDAKDNVRGARYDAIVKDPVKAGKRN